MVGNDCSLYGMMLLLMLLITWLAMWQCVSHMVYERVKDKLIIELCASKEHQNQHATENRAHPPQCNVFFFFIKSSMSCWQPLGGRWQSQLMMAEMIWHSVHRILGCSILMIHVLTYWWHCHYYDLLETCGSGWPIWFIFVFGTCGCLGFISYWSYRLLVTCI